MNLLEHEVIKVLGKPYKKYDHWFIDVETECYGRKGINLVMVDLYCEALKIKIGYKFLS